MTFGQAEVTIFIDDEGHATFAARPFLTLDDHSLAPFSGGNSGGRGHGGEIVCDGSETPEGEPVCGPEYVDGFNGGLNSTPPVYSPITCGEAVCGTTGNFLVAGVQSRDTDWYLISLGAQTDVTWTATADGFAHAITTVDISVPGGATVGDYLTSTAGETLSVTNCLAPGDWALFVSTAGFVGVPCNSQYQASVTCGNCVPPPAAACCLVGGSCQELTQTECTNAGGNWQGEGSLCSFVACPAGPCGPGNGDCFSANGTPGCDDEACCLAVCAIDPFCCDTSWDSICAGEALDLCEGAPTSGACCHPDGSCTDEPDVVACTATGGTFQGVGTVCEAVICEVACDPGDIPEGEPVCFDGYVDTYDSGCKDNPPSFLDVACGESYCGTFGTFLDGGVEARDTDWYRLALTEQRAITWSGVADGDLFVGILDTGGIDDCAGVIDFVDFATAPAGVAAVSSAILPAGTWYLFVSPSVFSGVPCGTQYVAAVTCEEVVTPTGACCFVDGGCQDVSSPECASAGGVYEGDDSACFLLECPTACGSPTAGSCVEPHPSPGCEDAACCATVCAVDPACCTTAWDPACADLARGYCAASSLPCPADVDGDSFVAFSDLLQLLGAWGPYAPCPPYMPADIDRDCDVDFGDLLDLLGGWGPCPDNPGACCLIDGGCLDEITPALCDLIPGIFAGPSTVCGDVECADQACVVTISGPDCICKGRTCTFTGMGTTAGGTYAWAITAGGNKASIQGAANMQTVMVRGDNTSAAGRDVTLKVTYTVGGVVCMAEKKLTVIEVALTLKVAGMWDAGNGVPQAAKYGDPTLGPVTPGAPAGTTGFHKNIQIKGTISPCVAGLPCAYDFKREKQGRSGVKPAGGGAFVPDALDCPAPAWCDDDAGNGDEDLMMDAPPACTIYVMDSPGFQTGGMACIAAGDIFINSKNFREWLEVDGKRCTDNLDWHASTRIKCTMTAPGVFKWTLDAGGAGNVVGAGHIQIPAPLQGPEPERYRLDWVLALLVSPSTADRLRGQNAVLDAHAADAITAPDRAALAAVLIGLTGAEKETCSMWSTPMLALRLLGVLQAEEGIPVLLDRIADEFPRPITSDLDRYLTVAGISLVRYGEGAIGPILDRAGTATDEEWSMLARVLRVLGDEGYGVRRAVRQRLDGEPDGRWEVIGRKRLEALPG